jgi:subtilisin family serine protease
MEERCVVLRYLKTPGLPNDIGVTFRGTAVGDLEEAFPMQPKIEVESMDRAARLDLLRDPEVVEVVPTMPTRLIEPVAFSAAGRGDAWGISAVGAKDCEYSGRGVKLAVLDTGIDRTHPAFAGVNIVEQDFTGSGNGDRQGHGTHCAGTIFGRDVNGRRIGIARGVESVLIGKVISDNAGGDSEMLFKGLTWAADNGADVVSMSLGFDFTDRVRSLVEGSGWPIELATSDTLEVYRNNIRVFDSLMDSLRARQAFSGGSVVVAASGNESRRSERKDYVIGTSVPAAAFGIVSVGAVSRSGKKFDIAPFSNAEPSVCAPGVDITSAKVGGGLTNMSGTSMACPHAAGVAALWWEYVRSHGLPRRADIVSTRMIAAARPDVFTQATTEPDRGCGLVSAPM